MDATCKSAMGSGRFTSSIVFIANSNLPRMVYCDICVGNLPLKFIYRVFNAKNWSSIRSWWCVHISLGILWLRLYMYNGVFLFFLSIFSHTLVQMIKDPNCRHVRMRNFDHSYADCLNLNSGMQFQRVPWSVLSAHFSMYSTFRCFGQY